jgi:hypothetical protein
MDEPPAFKFPIAQNAPSAPAALVAVIVALPGKLDQRQSVPFADSTIEPSLNGDELKVPDLIRTKFDERWNNKIQRLLIPQFHRCDSPATDERVRGLLAWHPRCSSRLLTLAFPLYRRHAAAGKD